MAKAGRTAHSLLTGLSVVPDPMLGYHYDRQAILRDDHNG